MCTKCLYQFVLQSSSRVGLVRISSTARLGACVSCRSVFMCVFCVSSCGVVSKCVVLLTVAVCLSRKVPANNLKVGSVLS